MADDVMRIRVDVETAQLGKLKDALQWRQQAAAGLQNAANKDQYEHYTSLISNIDQMFSKALPADQYNAYAKSVGAAPIPSAPTVAPMTNREAGAALTAPEDAIPVVHSKAEAMKKDPGSLFRDSTGVVWFVEGPGQFKRVNGK